MSANFLGKVKKVTLYHTMHPPGATEI